MLFFFNFELFKYIFISFFLFILGFLGIFITRKNILIILMSIEILILSVNVLFVFFSIYLDNIIGQIFFLFVLTIAAAETAIGLALIVIYYRIYSVISTDFICNIKG